MSIENTALYKSMKRRVRYVPAGPSGLLGEFERLREILQEHGKYIVLLFPEYTPHDHTRHLDHLFSEADRILGAALYKRLKPSELVLLAFGLYAHDWGMAVSEAERKCLENGSGADTFALLPDEPQRAQEFISEALLSGSSPEGAWRDYLRQTHGLRSGQRLRRHLEALDPNFADAVAKIAEGHTLNVQEVRDPNRYPHALGVFGETVNLAALTTYVRMVDLLDIGVDRTPYALWKFVLPADSISNMEWRKHRALSPVAVRPGSRLREVAISGRTDDSAVFAALADLQSWIDEQFAMSMAQLRTISSNYDLDLDSRILWSIETVGFEPLAVRFELDRSQVLGLLSTELYEDDPLAFLRELLQNSVDAIDMREALMAKHAGTLNGKIHIRISSMSSGLRVEWSDNGIGMDAEVLISYFAKLGLSWYGSREARRFGHIEAISRFGVGVLSYFAVTNKLAVETRRDPQAGSASGLSIEIPKRESHFRIRTATNLPVGTKITLEVGPSFSPMISGEGLREALARIARYVRHRITVDFDGVTSEIGFLAPGVDDGDGSGRRKIAMVGMHGDSAKHLDRFTTTIVFEFGKPGGDYHGHYSAVIPRKPRKVRRTSEHRVWLIEGAHIDFNDILVDTEQTLFVKGIQAGRVRSSILAEPNAFSVGRYTEWISPKFLVDVRNPSWVGFNLSRSSVRLESSDWVDTAWREIADKLRVAAFPWPLESTADTAILLGSTAVFGGVPDCGLDALVGESETPLLIVRSGEGLVWTVLREFTNGVEFTEAPFELNYANNGELLGFGSSSGTAGWEGNDALFPTNRFNSKRYPWLGSVLGLGLRALFRLGWCPVEIRMVHPPENEELPLVCRVWRNCGAASDDGDFSTQSANERLQTPQTWRALLKLYSEAPELLRFPEIMSKHAAIGSRYWNINHPKVVRIVAILKLLTERFQQMQLSVDGRKMVSYLKSSAFIGYPVASRKSGRNLALELPNRLLAVAEGEGLGRADRLVPSDFVPGSIENYENPYYYSLNGWDRQGIGLGKRLE